MHTRNGCDKIRVEYLTQCTKSIFKKYLPLCQDTFQKYLDTRYDTILYLKDKDTIFKIVSCTTLPTNIDMANSSYFCYNLQIILHDNSPT